MPRGGKRPGAGRPKKYGGELLDVDVSLPLTRTQAERYRDAAGVRNQDLRDWMREVCDKAAARVLGK